MPRESKAAKKARATQINDRLAREYPDAWCSLDYQNPLQLLVATILAAQCTDERVNQVTPALFDKYPDAQAFARATQEELQQEIRSTGFFRNKARNIIGACGRIVQEHGGKVPETMEQLVALPGVARKTANVVLGTALGKNEGVVVDTHVKRLSNRLKLTAQSDPVKIEKDLCDLLPRQDWTMFSHRLVFHGRATCTARKPDCDNCCIQQLCPSGGKVQAPS
jgi:endonuclease-3